MIAPFGVRLRNAMRKRGPLCVGIDPHAELLAAWGLTDDVAGLERFAMTCVEALAGEVAVLKPQSAFFERHGSGGIAVLERVVQEARQAGAVVITDAKRGDIGSTMTAYAQAYLDQSSPLATDALTVSPYLGYESLRPALEVAAAQRAGVFVLALTSNPDGAQVQHARSADGASVAAAIVAGVARDNQDSNDLGDVGLVVGATIGDAVAELGIDLAASHAPLLAPGIGAQGAGAAELERVFGAARGNVLPSSSREVLGAGPSVTALRDAAARTVDSCRAVLHA
ncbi:orotidine-5'-phosphate decarboxylase [Angustibacter sp. McL0619]|uniref:orotidine-5'-phosphate decarboxylase n=1 Tax=Angustibacter sp. McL0619 TaxID=3415676 RepID=UPI003CE9EAF7